MACHKLIKAIEVKRTTTVIDECAYSILIAVVVAMAMRITTFVIVIMTMAMWVIALVMMFVVVMVFRNLVSGGLMIMMMLVLMSLVTPFPQGRGWG